MTDLELFKAIVRAVTGVPSTDVGKALAKVRALLGEAAPAATARKAPASKDRMYSGGFDRSGDE